ncbi:hypothetical protein Aph02nite_39410 [Actinoplanes philippinensis]|uniref:Uncharacterized protein n=1 Tax=Actinoplanes philippinensis TaxID=35752 RepID=A0A1I2GR18_9ACTN|nr:hypothetical protein [Actinoplanes philippinensis]GIE77991.1 hypothetical protein Aph02nite_39410 [Actinoplanes philippinensis]SFF19683.1 hypothetical protein SAMN05421541_10776 [Actinoplanes philippinensis]
MGRALRWVVPLAGIIALVVWWASYATTIVVWELRKLTPWLVLVLLVVVLYAVPQLISAALRRGERQPDYVGVLAGLGALIGLALGIGWLFHDSYQRDRDYASAMTVVDDPVPGLAARAPYLVGKAQAAPNLGDVTGEIFDITYLPDADRFGTLVERRGWLSGYEVGLVQQVPLGSNGRSSQRCAFDLEAAGARVGGWFGHNLGRLIANEQRWVRFDERDVYVYCDGDTPMVVVPLKRQVGVLTVTERPAGAALYNGRTGQLTITNDTARIPGPTYPISLAARQREGTAAVGGFADWWAERGGWDASDDGANEGNNSEFTLRFTDGTGSAYVTPLTPQGEASSVVAVSTVPTRQNGLGLAPMTVHRLNPTWSSPEAVVALIKAEYRDVCCWNSDRVFEVVPTGGTTWTATIGSEQSIRYRIEGRGQVDGREATCLKSAEGALIRCAYAAPGSPEEQELKRIEEQKRQQQEQPGQTGDLSRLTDQQLAELNKRLAEEMNRRLTTG